MRMADQRGVARVGVADVQQRLQQARGAAECLNGLDGCGHPSMIAMDSSGILVCMAIDPIALTRKLVDIESTTYNEGRCGVFLDEYLRSLGYNVERQKVEQPG